MITSEFLKKIRRIQITTSRMVSDVFAGQYHSVFKGRGMEFNEVREYVPGDEIRTIDWNVTARMGHPYVKKFVEERELTVMLLLDVSSSCAFGTVERFKSQLAAELCSLLAFSAIKNNDKVGLIAYSQGIEKFLPPQKGTRHVLRVIREALYQTQVDRAMGQRMGTSLVTALEYLNKVCKRKAVVFVISDFYPEVKGKGSFDQVTAYEQKILSVTNKKHDVIAVTLTDPRDSDLPAAGLLRLQDAETGEVFLVDSKDSAVRREYQQRALDMVKRRNRMFSAAGVDLIDVRTDVPYWKALIRFFKERERRYR